MILALCMLASLGLAHGAIMAVDLGSEWLKVSVVKPGRSPFSIVVNEMCVPFIASCANYAESAPASCKIGSQRWIPFLLQMC